MRGQLPISMFAIIFGALEVAGGVQELVYRGILNSQTEPLVVGTFGTLAGVLLLVAGILLLIRSQRSGILAQAAAFVSVPVFVLIGIVKHYAGWPVTLVGIAYPLFLVLYAYKIVGPSQLAPKT